MKKKIRLLVLLCIPLLGSAFFSIRYLVSFATVFDEMSLENFRTDNVLFYEDVSFEMFSSNALLINLTSGEVIFEHEANVRVYPASLTKLMTVLIGLEQATGDTMIVKADFEQLMLDNASIVGFAYGEERSLMEILHGAMLPSGADATATIAYNIAGSYEGFVELMNKRARELGMQQTNFTNASGLHNENHYSIANDMAILLRYALDNPIFREIFMTKEYPFMNYFGEQSVMKSTLFTNLWTTSFTGGEIIGGRTGFTSEAGRCLASLASNGEEEFILITFGADSNEDNQTTHIFDAFTIYEYFSTDANKIYY